MASSNHKCPVTGNSLLELMPRQVRERLMSRCESVTLRIRDTLYESNQPIESVYFPLNGVMSVVAPLDGDEIEVATIGREGMLGLPVVLGTESTPLRAFAQVPGEALRLPASVFKRLIKAEASMRPIFNRYTQALMMQIAQSTACNRAHGIEQRCCRWLLMTHDRVNADEFLLTQEFLAQMLGVRRATVSEVASTLQAQGLIEYSRGRMKIKNRRGLERKACECYGIIRDEYDRLIKF